MPVTWAVVSPGQGPGWGGVSGQVGGPMSPWNITWAAVVTWQGTWRWRCLWTGWWAC